MHCNLILFQLAADSRSAHALLFNFFPGLVGTEEFYKNKSPIELKCFGLVSYVTVTPSPSPPPCLCLNTPSPQHKIVLVSSWAALTLCAGNKSLVSHLRCCCVNTACCQDETQAPPCQCCGLCQVSFFCFFSDGYSYRRTPNGTTVCHNVRC